MLPDLQDEPHTASVVRKMTDKSREGNWSRVDESHSVVLSLGTPKKKAPADPSAKSSRAGAEVLRRALPSRAKSSWLAKASGRSPGLASRCASTRPHIFTAGSLPDPESVARHPDGFESFTVAGPRGNLTRFPILPDSFGAPEAIMELVKDQLTKKQPSIARQRSQIRDRFRNTVLLVSACVWSAGSFAQRNEDPQRRRHR